MTQSSTTKRRNKKAALKVKTTPVDMDELEIKKVEYSHLLYKLNMNHL